MKKCSACGCQNDDRFAHCGICGAPLSGPHAATVDTVLVVASQPHGRRKACPVCQRAKTRRAVGRFASSFHQVFYNRICDGCGTAWRPDCPRWTAVAMIILGCVIPVAFIAIQWSVYRAENDLNALMRSQGGANKP